MMKRPRGFPGVASYTVISAQFHPAGGTTAMAANENVPISISKNQARAGVTGHNVRYVLAFGLGGIIVAFIIVGMYFGM
jgi:hypothetical protein